ncbi:hypothetical protein HDU87_003137 [Geranomyces variabilis]|uniref:Cyclin-Q n=1 Tax=Geranomyces variabilis TaxID=109894 RepID=A0AAD5XSY5_9FUNG|nr:hypothetical protein HDU87_003137 [Geranomyces variabilis]
MLQPRRQHPQPPPPVPVVRHDNMAEKNLGGQQRGGVEEGGAVGAPGKKNAATTPPYRPVLEFIVQAGSMLHVEPQTSAAALVYYHRYNAFIVTLPANQGRMDDYMAAMACVHLSAKQCEEPLKMRDVINVCYWLVAVKENAEEAKGNDENVKGKSHYRGRDPYLVIGDEYWDLKTSLMTAELALLRILRFDVGKVRSPFPYVVGLLADMRKDLSAIHADGDGRKQMTLDDLTAVAQTALGFAHDAHLCPRIADDWLAMPVELALAATYLALRVHCIAPRKPFVEWCMYEGLEREEVAKVEDLVQDIMAFIREWREKTP